MKKEDMDRLDADLNKIVKKYKLTNCAFCGNDEEGQFVGQMLTAKTYTGVWETSLNIGRQWQFCREQIRTITNQFDRTRREPL